MVEMGSNVAVWENTLKQQAIQSLVLISNSNEI